MDVKPNAATLLAILPSLDALRSVKESHAFAIRRTMRLESGLVEAYGQCGGLVYARRVFDGMQDRDVRVWSSMVSACAFHGMAGRAKATFREMERENVRPDGDMLLEVLEACCSAGMAKDAVEFFKVFKKKYRVEVGTNHYLCLVDVLSQVGRVKEAHYVVGWMPKEEKMNARELIHWNNVFVGGNHDVDNMENDSDISIFDDITDPVSSSESPVSEMPQPVKPLDELLSLQKALQDMSQPISEANPPADLLAIPLLRHQRIALSWMVHKETASSHCCGGILADDQGLGKTISTIALILTERSPSSKYCAMLEKQDECEPLNLDDDDKSSAMKQSCNYMSRPIKKDTYVNVVKGRPQAGTLVVCPTSVLRQWADELQNKVTRKGNLSILIYHGANRTKDPNELAKYDVVLTTYAIVRMEVPIQPLKEEEIKSESLESVRPLGGVEWFRVVLDEAQIIKNHRTKTAMACWGLRAKRRWCLSGTPIQNSIDDLYSYFRFLKFDPYEKYDTFRSMKELIKENSESGYRKLQAVLKLIMLRRTKGTLLDGKPIVNLPPKSISLQKVKFSNEEHSFYKTLETKSQKQYKRYVDAGTDKQNYCNLLVMLMRLRQACNHRLLVKERQSISIQSLSLEMEKKLPRAKKINLISCLKASLTICGICNDAPEDSVVTICGHVFCNQCILEHLTVDKNICPSSNCKVQLSIDSIFSKSTLERSLSDQLGNDSHSNYPTNQIKYENKMCEDRPSYPLSSKLKAALEILKSLPKSGASSETHDRADSSGTINLDSDKCSGNVVSEKAIVFSQWTRMLDLLEAPLRSCSIQFRRLDGTMSVAARQNAIKDFNTRPEVTVMIMSLKAGNLGLNMVAANHVILLDPWWNPTTEDQAIDKVHRIGQTRPVTVSRLTVVNTVENRILRVQERKRKMVASAFGEDGLGTNQNRLTEEDLEYLFMV